MFRRMREYQHKLRQEKRLAQRRSEYSWALRQVDSILAGTRDSGEIRAVYDFAIKTVKRDIISFGYKGSSFRQKPPYLPNFIPESDYCRESTRQAEDFRFALLYTLAKRRYEMK